MSFGKLGAMGRGMGHLGALGRPGTGWVLRDTTGSRALLDWYNAQSKLFYNGTAYSTDADLSSAIGATGTWPKKIIGPNVFGSTIVQNGANPITDTTGWTAVQAGGVVASGGSLVQTNGTGGTSGLQLYQDISPTIGSVYEIKVTISGGFGRQIQLVNSSNSVQMLLGSGLGAGSYTYYVAIQSNVSRLMLQSNSVSNGGTVSWTGISIKECRAFLGLLPNGTTFAVRFTTPSSIASDQVIAEFAGVDENNRCRLVYKQSTGHVLFIETRSTTVTSIDRFTLDLGAVSASTAYRVAVAVKNGAYFAAINGAVALTSATADYPNTAIFYNGTDSASADFLGAMDRTTIFALGGTTDFVSGLSNPGNVLLMPGDSYVAGSGGVGLSATAVTAGKAVCSPSTIATGGTTDVAQLAALQAAPGYKNYNVVWWDGRANTGYDSTLYVQNQQTFASFIGHSRYIRVLPVACPGDDGETQAKILATCAALKAIIPAANYIDPVDYVPNTAGIINADQLQGDGAHLVQAAMDLVWAAVDTKATALGMYSYVTP
jgi:hypothetical protein